MNDLMTPKEVAKLLRISKLTLVRWARRSEHPLPFIRINSRGDRRYRRKDVERFLKEGFK